MSDTTEARVSPVKVAVVQFEPRVGVENLQRNTDAVTQRIGRAADQGAGLIVLPELATTGYVFQTREEAFAHAEAVPDGATVELLSRLAAERDLYLVACIVERDGDRLYDTAVLVGPTGYVGRYRKTHLWNTEKLWFTPGDEGYKVFDTPIGRIGLPAVIKTRRFGYDGKGQVRLSGAANEAAAAWEAVKGQPCILEGFVSFEAEFSVILVRGADGDIRFWDSPQNVHVDGILATSTLPAPALIQSQTDAARALAAKTHARHRPRRRGQRTCASHIPPTE